MSAHVALAGCQLSRPRLLDERVEIVSATASPRGFPYRVSPWLGICLKYGAAHTVRSGGRKLIYPRDSVCVRPPGCVWASEVACVGFLSIDVAPELCSPAVNATAMSFCRADALPDLAHLRAELDRADTPLRAQELIAGLVVAVIDAGALPSDGSDRAAVRRAQDFLIARPEENPSLEDIAGAAGLNKFTLLRQFRRSLGTTPHAYLILLRIERARGLLARGVPAVEAAALSGFADQAHMTRQFKRLVGLTPTAYARAARTLVGVP
jgi:AraC-like DNA-binding protein